MNIKFNATLSSHIIVEKVEGGIIIYDECSSFTEANGDKDIFYNKTVYNDEEDFLKDMQEFFNIIVIRN